MPPTTVVGLSLSELSAGGLTVIVACRVTPPKLAERVETVGAATAVLLIVKDAVVAPDATVTPLGVAV